MMLRSAVLLGLTLLAPVPASAQDPSYVLNPDQLEIYSLALKDVVRSFARPSANWQAGLAFDPYIHRDPGKATRLSEEPTRTLLRASQLRQLCEPWGRDACRGPVRGIVIHLSEIAFPTPDSAQVVVTTTRARSEFDHTVLVPEVRYYAYDLKRDAGKWKVTLARRRLPSWSPS